MSLVSPCYLVLGEFGLALPVPDRERAILALVNNGQLSPGVRQTEGQTRDAPVQLTGTQHVQCVQTGRVPHVHLGLWIQGDGGQILELEW